MRVSRLTIQNFRGIRACELLLPRHGVLIGDNNIGKTTVLEALDLVLGPERLNRIPPIDEHDFFRGKYIVADGEDQGDATETGEDAEVTGQQQAPRIEIEVTITDLSDEQKARFGHYAEWWDTSTGEFYEAPDPAGIDAAHIAQALRVTFHGSYDPKEDDFVGHTYFTRSLTEEDQPARFARRDKQACGFLYLRSRRTGSRALTLERGSLLDIILRQKELRPQMWEDTIRRLAEQRVADRPELGITEILETIDAALQAYVPREWGTKPHLKVSNLTREHLRKIITAFIATSEADHAAPFYRQGSGTLNMLVLAMLSLIAEGKKNVIFAMEEPETAIPPYAQKRVVQEVRKQAAQALFTSHSPYVLEEFAPEETIVLARNSAGVLLRREILLPEGVKLKRYRQEFRTRFCEGLLSRRVLVAEGATEATALPAVCRRLEHLKPDTYASLEALGICTIDAGGDGNIAGMAQLYRNLGKSVFAICDNQPDETTRSAIEAEVDVLFMHGEKGFEDLVMKNTTLTALKRFARTIELPPHLAEDYPDKVAMAEVAVGDYLRWGKGAWTVADFLAQCEEPEIPAWLRETCLRLRISCATTPVDPGEVSPGIPTDGPEERTGGASEPGSSAGAAAETTSGADAAD